ncbi:hypothetical protein P280DRAFT_518443 [Massarina eburnea CBS 473.64]|uniref:JmjC domain-containing histone demethylation protein 1 n=1 Tax=Massarina eburnea CBS 473.64 TaxID=1395130 RepID=A0A6A6RYF3_9PLEO|nr:hypothetical protein P280DRAFT_518443 [Massarina eburnea CBS 473.64]
MRPSSFKPQYRQAPPRAATPPPPVWEPLSPVLAPRAAPTAPPAQASNGDTTSSRDACAGPIRQPPAPSASARAPPLLGLPPVAYEPSMRSAPLPQRSHAPYSPAYGSPIEALATAAAVSSLHASPSYAISARRSAQALAQAQAQAHAHAHALPHPPGQRAPKHAYPLDGGYTHDERPSKRARSEHFSSPQYGQHCPRPATSHIPGWSYNVEHMADNGLRMYRDPPSTPQFQDDNSLKRLSDAQLLMDFAAAASTPRRTPSSKRWSISHTEASPSFSQLPAETNGLYPESSRSHYAHVHQMPPPPEYTYPPELPPNAARAVEHTQDLMAAQTQTPPEESLAPAELPQINGIEDTEEAKPKKHQGWPKGKPRGPRNGSAGTGGKRKKSTPKPKSAPSTVASDAPAQLHSPQSLQAEQQMGHPETTNIPTAQTSATQQHVGRVRRHSFSDSGYALDAHRGDVDRARSAPLQAVLAITPPVDDNLAARADTNTNANVEPVTICAGCNSSDSDTTIGDGEQWIRCDGCKEWHHYACAGFKSEREVRDVDKFYCEPCEPRFGATTKVRKSTRAHTAVDYAGLNEGILKTSDDNPEHHYIAAFKNGDIEFTPETFARIPPELVSADFLEKTNGFKEPILIPAKLNPRPKFPSSNYPSTDDATEAPEQETDESTEDLHVYETVPDDGQDKLDMVIPQDLTVRRVCELYGPQEKVPVIDVKAQEGEDKKWNMAKWADYYEQQGEKPVRNVISLEVSKSRLGRLIRRPKAVRDLDLQDSVWRDDDKKAPPAVQFYCLMSVADCYTDFHIDFGGSSVYYHIVKGKKVFFFIPPTKQNLKKYEDWCLSPKQGHEFLGHQVKECYRVDLYPGDTMLIPSGWIHAVWTPDDSLVIGGNFLTRIHYSMQIKVLEIEKNTKVAAMFRYPFFQKIMWLALIKYLEEDPLPESVERHLLDGKQFPRSTPVYCEPQRFGHNSHLGPQNYNRRYYSKAELEGVPDLANFVWRTVLISQGRVEGITETVRKAVTSSIPKGFGEPIVLARRFAMWIAWKKGNENIPQWAYPDATLPEASDAGEKKMSAAQLKRMERDAWGDALRANAERHSTRIKSTEAPRANGVEAQPTGNLTTPQSMTGFLQQTDPSRPLTTPKTSQLGPKRIACDACRKRRIRCKHKEESVKAGGGMNGGLNTIDLSGSLGLSVKRRYSDLDDTPRQQSHPAETAAVVNGGPLLADVNADPYALKSGRVKACADCRKSKRRCIHDEYGNVDPIKANEIPIPRGAASKKRRISEEDPNTANRKMKKEARNSLPAILGMPTSNDLLDLAFSAQQALNQVVPEEMIDPALQSYDDGDMMMHSSPQESHRDAIMSSIENIQDTHMEDVDAVVEGHQGPSVEPLTPGPIVNNFSEPTNGFKPAAAPPITPNQPPTARPSSRGPKGTPHSRKHYTPKSTPGRRRQASGETFKVEPRSDQKARAISSATGEGEDTASLALALKLQMEEHGLRRRSK